MVILGACKADHSLGDMAPDSGPDLSSAAAEMPPAQAQADTSVQTALNSAPDARQVGTLGPVQSWTGYIELHQFKSGSDTIKLSFAADSFGQVVGQVILGNGTAPPPATDPNVGYPEGKIDLFSGIEGFPYSMLNGNFAANRLRFTLQGLEPWGGWCALQTPVADSDTCLPQWMSNSDGNQNQCFLVNPVDGYGDAAPDPGLMVSVDCGKLILCNEARVCQCSTSSCGLNQSEAENKTTSFDIAVSNGTASGSMQGSLGGSDIHNVHFTKDP